jgi:hypothetical protein
LQGRTINFQKSKLGILVGGVLARNVRGGTCWSWSGLDLAASPCLCSPHKVTKNKQATLYVCPYYRLCMNNLLILSPSHPPFRQLFQAILSTALSIFQTEMVLVLLGLAFSRPVVASPSLKTCEGFGEVVCAGDPSHAWVNSNLTGPSLPPAGIIIHRVCVHAIAFLVVSKDWGAQLDYKPTQLSF